MLFGPICIDPSLFLCATPLHSFLLQVAEAIQESLEEIKARQDDIQRMKSDLGLGGDTDADAALR